MLDPNIPNPLSAAHAESPSRRHVSPWAIVGGAAAAGLLAWGLFAAVVIVLHPSEPPPAKARTGQDFTMPDGTILTLEKVTFGKRHEFEVDLGEEPRGFWSWTKRPSKRTVAMTAPKDMLGLWLTRRNPISGQALPFEWWQKCVAVDDNGCEITDEWAGFDICGFHRRSSTSGSRPWGAVSLDKQEKYIAHSILRPFRNNGKEFVLRVYDTAGTKVAEFKAPAPIVPPAPEWVPQALPAVQTAGDVTVTLKRFAAIPIQDPDVPPPRINLRPEFDVARNGQATTDWDTSQWSVLDPYGNLQFGWNCDLCPREPAWRLQLSLYRNENAMFDEAEQWTLSGIPRPDADTVNSLEGSKTLAGVTLGAASIGGAGKVTYLSFLPGVSSNSSASYGGSIPKGGLFRIEKKQEMGKSTTSVEADVPHFVVHLAGRTDEHRVFVQVTDDQGRRCQTQPITVDDLEFWFFSPEKDARKFDFRITVQQVRKVEFLVAPPQMPEAQP